MKGIGCGIAAAVGLVALFGLALLGGVVGSHYQASAPRHIRTVGLAAQLKPGSIPAQYVELITKAATVCPQISAPLLAAQIEQESGWNPDARSSAGARGIAQFMPATWQAVGKDYNGNGTASPLEPGDAIPAQAHYMCGTIARLKRAGIDGDLVNLALAAYNAGFGAVQRYGGIPPYPQTQAYVRRIRALARTYAATPDAAAGAGQWVTPVAGTCSSGFGKRWGSFHAGQDIAGPIGTTIHAAAAGRVIAAGPASGYGLWVKIDHGGGIVTIYGHIHTATVGLGQQVQAGEAIATRGNRGQSTGPHLHYQIEVDGHPVDPMSWHAQHGAPPLCGGANQEGKQ